jgi:tRNA A-37 threonylcarbamoyl transferase component Bud32
MTPVSARDLQQTLLNLPRVGRLIKDRPTRQVWRFECAGKPYYLKFYPTGGLACRLRRLFRGNPALREFARLQWLQKAAIPAPRAIATLMGYSINGQKGDAVITEALEPSTTLDQYLNHHELQGHDIPNHRALVVQLLKLLEKLGRAGLGHADLHLGNFLLKDNQLYLLDARALHKNGLLLKDLLQLAASAHPHATRADLYRAWQILGPGGSPPRRNRRAPRLWRAFLRRAFRNDRYFGHLHRDHWSGHFFKHARAPHRWSLASRLNISDHDWQQAWPLLLQQIQSDQFDILKRCRSGDVLAGEIILAGKPVPVVIKRSFRKYWHRYLTDIGRGHRARRAWHKAWHLIVRNIPTAWPLLLMEKRTLGYVTDAITVYERIPGHTLDHPLFSRLPREHYHQILHRAGRLLRRLENSNLFLYDAKATNWIIRHDEQLGPIPMLIDVDGVRRIRQSPGGLRRLLRSLHENPHHPFSPPDAQALLRGYAPFATARQLQRLGHPIPKVPNPSLLPNAQEARR